MNPEDFEERLSRRILKPLPGAWRSEILSAAFAEAAERTVCESEPVARWIPHHAGWAALAAVWTVIAAIQLANTRADQPPAASGVSSEAWNRYWREERRMIAELLDPPRPAVPAASDADLPKPRSGSRSMGSYSISPV